MIRKITDTEKFILEKNYANKKVRSKRASLLYYFKNHIVHSTLICPILSDTDFYNRYKKTHKVSKSLFLKMIKELKALGLIEVTKVDDMQSLEFLKLTKVGNVNDYSLPNEEDLEILAIKYKE